MMHVNFIPPHRVRRTHARRLVRFWGIALSCYVLLLAIVLPAGRVAMAVPETDRSEAKARAAHRVKVAESEHDAVTARLKVLEQRLLAADTAGNHPDHSLLLAALARTRGEDAAFSRISLRVTRSTPPPPRAREQSATPSATATPAPKQPADPARATQELLVKLSGFASAPGKIFELAQRIEQLNVFQRVRITSTRPGGPGGSTQFDLEALLSEAQESTP